MLFEPWVDHIRLGAFKLGQDALVSVWKTNKDHKFDFYESLNPSNLLVQSDNFTVLCVKCLQSRLHHLFLVVLTLHQLLPGDVVNSFYLGWIVNVVVDSGAARVDPPVLDSLDDLTVRHIQVEHLVGANVLVRPELIRLAATSRVAVEEPTSREETAAKFTDYELVDEQVRYECPRLDIPLRFSAKVRFALDVFSQAVADGEVAQAKVADDSIRDCALELKGTGVCQRERGD